MENKRSRRTAECLGLVNLIDSEELIAKSLKRDYNLSSSKRMPQKY